MYDIGPFLNPCSNCPGMWTLAWRDHQRSCQEDCRDSKCSLRRMTIGPPDGLPSWGSISSWQGVSLLTPQKKRWWTGWHISGFLPSSRWFYYDSLFFLYLCLFTGLMNGIYWLHLFWLVSCTMDGSNGKARGIRCLNLKRMLVMNIMFD